MAQFSAFLGMYKTNSFSMGVTAPNSTLLAKFPRILVEKQKIPAGLKEAKSETADNDRIIESPRTSQEICPLGIAGDPESHFRYNDLFGM